MGMSATSGLAPLMTATRTTLSPCVSELSQTSDTTRFHPTFSQCLGYSPSVARSVAASVECAAPEDSCDPCGVPRHACMVGLRRVGLHRRFHAQGTTSRLACRLSAMELAKDLKTMRVLSRVFVFSPSSIASSVLPSQPVEGYVPFTPSSNTFPDYVERICF
jgi:hypothetical protein